MIDRSCGFCGRSAAPLPWKYVEEFGWFMCSDQECAESYAFALEEHRGEFIPLKADIRQTKPNTTEATS